MEGGVIQTGIALVTTGNVAVVTAVGIATCLVQATNSAVLLVAKRNIVARGNAYLLLRFVKNHDERKSRS